LPTSASYLRGKMLLTNMYILHSYLVFLWYRRTFSINQSSTMCSCWWEVHSLQGPTTALKLSSSGHSSCVWNWLLRWISDDIMRFGTAWFIQCGDSIISTINRSNVWVYDSEGLMFVGMPEGESPAVFVWRNKILFSSWLNILFLDVHKLLVFGRHWHQAGCSTTSTINRRYVWVYESWG